ncbi:hypothetical protein P7C70_g8275, partial [Phenoliferia sp. Uapishka_3]
MELYPNPNGSPFPRPSIPSSAHPRPRPALYPNPATTLPRHLNLQVKHGCRIQLPQEIISFILELVDSDFDEDYDWSQDDRIEEVARSDLSENGYAARSRQETLRLCCLVSRSFKSVAERLLYRRVYSNHDCGAGKVLQELLARPGFAIFVQFLHLHQCNIGDHTELNTLSILPNLIELHLSVHWASCAALVDILITLLRRTTFHSQRGLQMFKFFIMGNDSSRLPSEVGDGICRMLSLLPSTVTSLELSCPTLTPRDLAVQFSLNRLHLIHPHFNSPLLKYLTGRSHETLWYLVFEIWAKLSRDTVLTVKAIHSLSTYPLEHLQLLGFQLHSEASLDILYALATLPTTLQRLHLPASFSIPNFLESSSCPNLIRLSLYDEIFRIWFSIVGEVDAIKVAAEKRGLFLVPVQRCREYDDEGEGKGHKGYTTLFARAHDNLKLTLLPSWRSSTAS